MCFLIKKNLELTKLTERAEIIHGDVFWALNVLYKKEVKFSFIYLDPPYSYPLLKPVLEAILDLSLLRPGGEVILEQNYNKEHVGSFLQNELPIELILQRKYGNTLLSFGKPK